MIVTYEQAERWLRAVGGHWVVGTETEDYDSVIAIVPMAAGQEISRHVLIKVSQRGEARRAAVRRALAKACDMLRAELRARRASRRGRT